MNSEESREVAARLRKCGAELSIIGADCETAFHVIDEVIGCRELESWERFLGRLAGLIDPTCRNVSGYQDVFECSECRCRVELTSEVCNEYGEPFSTPFMPSFCPGCGGSVVSGDAQ